MGARSRASCRTVRAGRPTSSRSARCSAGDAAGRARRTRRLLDQLAPAGPVYQAGTLSGNPLAVAAGIATLARPRPRLPPSRRRRGHLASAVSSALTAAEGVAHSSRGQGACSRSRSGRIRCTTTRRPRAGGVAVPSVLPRHVGRRGVGSAEGVRSVVRVGGTRRVRWTASAPRFRPPRVPRRRPSPRPDQLLFDAAEPDSAHDAQ